jgi:hypothetical protein
MIASEINQECIQVKTTGILIDTTMAVGTDVSKYFAIEIAEMAVEHEGCFD